MQGFLFGLKNHTPSSKKVSWFTMNFEYYAIIYFSGISFAYTPRTLPSPDTRHM